MVEVDLLTSDEEEQVVRLIIKDLMDNHPYYHKFTLTPDGLTDSVVHSLFKRGYTLIKKP